MTTNFFKSAKIGFARRIEICRCCTFFGFRENLPTYFFKNVGRILDIVISANIGSAS